jgi:nicotinamidase-related amidase
VIIDMQRDFVQPGGFGEALGNDVIAAQGTIEPTGRVLNAHASGMLVIHTREGIVRLSELSPQPTGPRCGAKALSRSGSDGTNSCAR